MELEYRKASTTFISANSLEVTVEHNGYKGGDAGHGGYVTVELIDQGGTCMEIYGKDTERICFTFRGDYERDTLIQSLKFIIDELTTYPSMNSKESQCK